MSEYPVEWLPDLPSFVRRPPREHPRSWQPVLLAELEKDESLEVHVIVARKHFEKSLSFVRNRTVFHLVKTPPLLRAPSLFWVDTLLIKRVMSRIGPDVIHAWGTEKGEALVASRLGWPYIVTIQGLITWYAECAPLNGYERWAGMLESVALRRAPIITSESNFSCDFIRRKFQHRNVEHIEVVPDLSFGRVNREPQTKPFRLVFTGQVGPRKGGDVLVRALDRLRTTLSFDLVVIGRMAENIRPRLERETSKELWSRISFKPNLTTSQVAEELAKAAILVCPSRADTGPMAAKEAVVAGVPVVGTRVGGMLDYIVEGRNGFLVEAGDVQQLAQAISAAAQHPLFGRGQVDADVLRQKRQYLSPEAMGLRFAETYRVASKIPSRNRRLDSSNGSG